MIYVTMSDKFMSNWGHSKGHINKLVFECETAEEAYVVKKNAESREEMKYINICVRKPRYSTSRYFTQYKTKETSPNWYKSGFFG